MNNLPNATSSTQVRHSIGHGCKPCPPLAIYVLVSLFLFGLAFSIFILAVVHNALFLVLFLPLSLLIALLVVWNSMNCRRNVALLNHLQSFPESDLRYASHGDLVKITGLFSCGSLLLESAYEKLIAVYTHLL